MDPSQEEEEKIRRLGVRLECVVGAYGLFGPERTESWMKSFAYAPWCGAAQGDLPNCRLFLVTFSLGVVFYLLLVTISLAFRIRTEQANINCLIRLNFANYLVSPSIILSYLVLSCPQCSFLTTVACRTPERSRPPIPHLGAPRLTRTLLLFVTYLVVASKPG